MKLHKLEYLADLKRNGHEGMISFVLQRITGIGLVAYLVLHMVSLSSILGGNSKYEESLSIYDSPIFHFAEWILLAAVVFHMFNGIRIVAVDWFGITRKQRLLFWLAFASSLVVVLGSIPFFFVWR